MKKIVVFSDSHGEVEAMVRVVKKEMPDSVFHLGDCMGDAQSLLMEIPQLSLEQVPGNCDYSQDMAVRVTIHEGFSILMCHGHSYHVKSGYLNLAYAAEEKGVDIALFGHTHHVYYADNNGVIYMNPGSIGNPPIGIPPSYGILVLDESTQTIQYDVKYLSDEA